MRATISFETDVDEVEGTMAVLACSEEHNLRAAADLLSNFTVLDGSVLDVITEALRLLDMSTDQLKQYRNMLVNFERARFETMLPQPAELVSQADSVSNVREVFEAAQNINKFGNFIEKLNSESAESGENGEQDDQQPQEG
jgi:hypothetical protein